MIDTAQIVTGFPRPAIIGRIPAFEGKMFICRFIALQQRILFDLLLDELLEFDMGQLQQPNRLHEQRRHHQRLGLS